MSRHGGPDALGVPRWDFSTNTNACGPEPSALRAVREADATRYPDPRYTALRDALAARHGVSAARIVLAASASEFIVRMTTLVARRRPAATVHAPWPGYGDYAAAARAQGLALAASASEAQLVWHTEPGSPRGAAQAAPEVAVDSILVIDCAYAPLRLYGGGPTTPAAAWQLWSPNKALGLTGIRGAYAVAPPGAEHEARALDALASSWPLGAHAVAMLGAWARPPAQAWVTQSLSVLREWKHQQLDLCTALGWVCEPSDTPFFVAGWPAVLMPMNLDTVLTRLRRQGLKLRDTTAMGLPHRVRLSVQPPAAQAALRRLWHELLAEPAPSGAPT